MLIVDDPNLPQFASDLACEAASIDLTTLKNWISRKPAIVHLEECERVQAGTKGTSFRFTLRRLLQLAITADLVRMHLPPREASLYAAQFTDVEDDPSRRMGELFRKHYTFMLIYTGSPHASIVNVKADEMWRLMVRKGAGAPHRFTSAVIVNLNQIDSWVRTVVGLPLTAREGVIK